jgi:hypothetical protein
MPSEGTAMSNAAEKFVAMVKPTTHGSGSHDALLDLLFYGRVEQL